MCGLYNYVFFLLLFFFFLMIRRPPRSTLFPTRRSSDLDQPPDRQGLAHLDDRPQPLVQDRKSTRLNSSHSQISYAVFCLKKKKKYITVISTILKITNTKNNITQPNQK